MKRDMNLVRAILLKLEEHEEGFAPEPFQLEGYSEDTVGFHVLIMREAGLVEAFESTAFTASSPSAIPQRLTWEGYEFLEAARNEKVWSSALKTFAATGVGLTIDVLKTWLVAEAKKMLGL